MFHIINGDEMWVLYVSTNATYAVISFHFTQAEKIQANAISKENQGSFG